MVRPNADPALILEVLRGVKERLVTPKEAATDGFDYSSVKKVHICRILLNELKQNHGSDFEAALNLVLYDVHIYLRQFGKDVMNFNSLVNPGHASVNGINQLVAAQNLRHAWIDDQIRQYELQPA